jgi:hypothetical protein
MIASEAMHQAGELRALLRDGALPSLGIVDVGKGSRLSFELAVRVTLAELTRLTHVADASHPAGPDRWHQPGDDLERLQRMAFAEPRPWGGPEWADLPAGVTECS